MNIYTREKKEFHVLDIAGKINKIKDSVNLKIFINELLEKQINKIAINLSKVSYLDSGALNVLIYSYNTLSKNNGTLVLIEPNEYVRDVCEVIGLDRIVKIYQTEEEFENDKANL